VPKEKEKEEREERDETITTAHGRCRLALRTCGCRGLLLGATGLLLRAFLLLRRASRGCGLGGSRAKRSKAHHRTAMA
jgi:hypothetical protein